MKRLLIADTSKIGIYSFAILFTEGFYMIYITIRKFINPRLSEANVKGTIIDYVIDINLNIKKYLLFASMGFYVLILVMYAFMSVIMKRTEYMIGLIYITIICAAMIINRKNIIFGDILAQLGYPLEESILNFFTVLSNFVFNLIFISIFGTVGAAIATGFSHFIFSFYMKYKFKKQVGMEI